MAEYIERQEVHSKINELPLTEDAVMEILWAVDDIPAADVAPVVHGRWKPIYSNKACEAIKRAMWYKCSECGSCTTSDDGYSCGIDYEFCPYCGAKMDL